MPSECPNNLMYLKSCPCACPGYPRAILEPKNDQEIGWSRCGPMGGLLEPKIYLGKCCYENACHRSNAVLQQIDNLYPPIFECARNATLKDLNIKTNRERLRSTYQIDYSHLSKYYSPIPEHLAIKQTDVTPPKELEGKCLETKTTKSTEYLGKCKYKDHLMKKSMVVRPKILKGTEYQDNISRLGGNIIKTKLHVKPRHAKFF